MEYPRSSFCSLKNPYAELEGTEKRGCFLLGQTGAGTMAAQFASLAGVRPAETKPNEGYH